MHTDCTRSVSGIGALSAACVKGTVLAVTLLVGIGSANADTLKLFSGSGLPTGSPTFTTNGTSVYSAIVGNDTACAGGGPGNCSGGADVHAGSITLPLGVTATGTGPTGTGAWYDLNPNYGGMGVGPLTGLPSDADQIAVGETLTFTFGSKVQLTGASTLFDNGHTPFGTFANGSAIGITNTLLLNGNTLTFFALNQGLFDFGTSTTWTFAAIAGQPDFYVSGLSWLGGFSNGGETPLPAAVWLFGGGLGLLAMFGRRKRKQKPVWEVTQNA